MVDSGKGGAQEDLTEFFARLRSILSCEKTLADQCLPNFFDALRKCLSCPPRVLSRASRKLPDPDRLRDWMDQLRQPLVEARRSSYLCDPWQVVGLNRDEVRNSKVLAWLLDPNGTHGLGDVFLRVLLAEIRHRKPGLMPGSTGRWVRVQTEVNPDSDVGNRVDVQVDAESFYLLVEVKINALEGERQMERYGQIAQCRAGQRPWGMVFLTTHGKQSVTAGMFDSLTVPVSWLALANAVTRAMGISGSSAAGGFGERIAALFLRHVRTF